MCCPFFGIRSIEVKDNLLEIYMRLTHNQFMGMIDEVLKGEEPSEKELRYIRNSLNSYSIIKRAPRFLLSSLLLAISRCSPVPLMSISRVRRHTTDALDISQALYELKIINRGQHEKIVQVAHSALFSSLFAPLS